MEKTRTRRRPALIALVIFAALGCLALGWWQWQRFEQASGTGQNLGYAFQWPLFAVFVIYAYRRFVQLETFETESAGSDSQGQPGTSADGTPHAAPVREIPSDLLPKRNRVFDDDLADLDDPEARQMLEYNTYLAELNSPSRNDRSTT